MFCPNCGSNLSDDSTFCPNCGTKIEQQHKPNNGSNLGKDFSKIAIECIKNPINEISNLKETLSDTNNYIYLGILALIIPLLITVSLKFFTPRIGEIMLFRKIFLSSLISLVVFYGIILFLTFTIYKFIFKEELNLQDFLKVVLAALIVRGAFMLVQFLVSIISFKLSIAVYIFGSMACILTLYSGFKETVKDSNKFLYTFSGSYLVAIFFTNYIIVKFVMMNIVSLFLESIFY